MNKVTQAEFARMSNVTRTTVNRWIATGRIQTEADGLIDPVAATRMREATESPLPHHQARKAQIEAAKAAKSAGEYLDPTQTEKTQHSASTATSNTQGDTVPAMEKLGAALKLETYKLQKAKAERENLALDKEAGLLVERAEVEIVLADYGATLRTLMEGLADRLSPTLAAHKGDVPAIHESLDAAAQDILYTLSEQIKRKMEAVCR
jgi:flagellar motor protein MotB